MGIRQTTGPDENREYRVLNDRTRQKTGRHDRGSEESKPVNVEKGLSGADGHEEKTREGSSTPTPDTSADSRF